jgi:hypothetical protein
MTTTKDDYVLLEKLRRVAPNATVEDANTLRRAELTLQRWAECECGDSNDYCSTCIERDEYTGKPYRVTQLHRENKSRRTPIADREMGALKRVKSACERLGLSFYHQGDCRGCMLYVSNYPLSDSNYNNGLACCS